MLLGVLLATTPAVTPPAADLSRRGALTAAAALLAGQPRRSGAAPDAARPDAASGDTSPFWVAKNRIEAGDDYQGTMPYDPWAHSSAFGLVPPPIAGQFKRDQFFAAARAGKVKSVQIAPQHDCVIVVTASGRRYSLMVPDSEFPALLLDAAAADGSFPFEVLPLDETRAKVRDAAGKALDLSLVLWLADLAGLLPWDTTPYGSMAEREEAQRRRQAGDTAPRKPMSDELSRAFGIATSEASEIRTRLKATAQRIKQDYEPAWVTPLTVEGELPSLEDLFPQPMQIWSEVASDGTTWAQYIRAHPTGEAVRRARRRFGVIGYNLPAPSAETTPCRGEGVKGIFASASARLASFASCGMVFDDDTQEKGSWRLCPHFSEFYGHDVYILKMQIA